MLCDVTVVEEALQATEWEVGFGDAGLCEHELLLWIFRSRDAEMMLKLERLEITQQVVPNHRDDLRPSE